VKPVGEKLIFPAGDETEEDDICPICDGDCSCAKVNPMKPTIVLLPPKVAPPPTFAIEKVAVPKPDKKKKKKQPKKRKSVQVQVHGKWDSDATSIDLEMEQEALSIMILASQDMPEDQFEEGEFADESDYEQHLLEHVAYPGIYQLDAVQNSWEALSNFDDLDEELDVDVSHEFIFAQPQTAGYSSTPRSYFLVDNDENPEDMERLVKQAKAALTTLKTSPWMMDEGERLSHSVGSTAPLPLEAVVDLTYVDDGPMDSATARDSSAATNSTNSEAESQSGTDAPDDPSPHARLRALSIVEQERPVSPNALRQHRAGDVMLGKMEAKPVVSFTFGSSITSPPRDGKKRELQLPSSMLPEEKVTIFPSLDQHMSDFWALRNQASSDTSEDDMLQEMRTSQRDSLWAKAYTRADQRKKQTKLETPHATTKRDQKEKKIAKKALDKLRFAKEERKNF
jgi:hypothetical protein